MNKSGRARRSRALVGSGIVAAAVVFGGAGPAPGAPEPLGPTVDYVDAFGPGIYGYEDCNGDVSTEEDPVGYVFVELGEDVDEETVIGISFSGSLADDLVDPPTEIVVEAGSFYGEATFVLDELESGDLTVTVEPGLGYVAEPDDTYTFEVTDEVVIVASCLDDLGTPPGGTDRQIIELGERPVPIGFFDEDEDEDGGEEPGESTTTTTEAPTTTTTTEAATTTSSEPVEVSAPFARARAVRAVPEGYDTPVANGTLPPGLTYVDDEWSGAATTGGLYSFDIRLCFDQSSFLVDGVPATAAERAMGRRQVRAFPDTICFGAVDVQVAVLDLTPPAAAPPATPVVADAQFAG